MTHAAPTAVQALLVRIGDRAAAIPLADVSETMRPVALEPIAGTPAFVSGVSIIRGALTPILDLKALLDGGSAQTTYSRLVTIRLDGGRHVALGVDSVVGVRTLASANLRELPPLLQGASSDRIEALGVHEARLLVVLRAARLVAPELWDSLTAGEGIA